MKIIAMDFIVSLPLESSTGTPWAKDGFNAFNSLLTVTYKSSKHTLLIPSYKQYSAQDWGEVLARHLLLRD